jgi:cyclopropane fatty-acyl-phospholipid synthase-like methyltransferase
MKDFWNARYAESEFAYGTEPNLFFREAIQNLPTGKILFPAEGEGRNAVYAATLGWEVIAFDQSETGKEKALMLSAKRGVTITYEVCSLEDFQAEESSFDALVLIFAHFPPHLRKGFHRRLAAFLKPGGILILEGFSKNHIKFNSVNEKAGGPKDRGMLFSKDELENDFSGFSISLLEEAETELEEGLYHVGKSSVIRMLAIKN